MLRLLHFRSIREISIRSHDVHNVSVYILIKPVLNSQMTLIIKDSVSQMRAL